MMHYQLFNFIICFLLWTFILYWIHRICHKLPYIKEFHRHHHIYINKNLTKWHWNNLFLFNDDWPSTVDLWITEVIPTIIFSLITGQWFIFLFYYCWASFLQENLEHKKNFNLPLLTCGKWHLKHHKIPSVNFGLFFPIWDLIFRTHKNVDK